MANKHISCLRNVLSKLNLDYITLLALVLICASSAEAARSLSSLSNFPLGTWSGSGPMGDDVPLNVCVYVTADEGGPNYKIKASTGHDPDFKVSDGSGHYIIFDVYWNDQIGTTGQKKMTAGDETSIGTQSGADTTQSDCGGTMNGNIEIEFTESRLRAAVAGTYSGTLTFTLMPYP